MFFDDCAAAFIASANAGKCDAACQSFLYGLLSDMYYLGSDVGAFQEPIQMFIDGIDGVLATIEWATLDFCEVTRAFYDIEYRKMSFWGWLHEFIYFGGSPVKWPGEIPGKQITRVCVCVCVCVCV